MKTKVYWVACWLCYWAGDLASKILSFHDNSNRWINFWYPIYNGYMFWSSNFQDAAGYDPQQVDDVSGWVWERVKEDDTGEK